MNHKYLLVFTLIVASSVAFLAAFPTGSAASSPAIQPQYDASEDAAFLGTEAARDRWNEYVRVQRVEAARHGIEWGRAGFHLMRPDDDPYWAPDYGMLGCSGNVYCWDVPKIQYPSMTYNAVRVPDGLMPPDPGTIPAVCQVSLDRLLSNSVIALSIEDEPNSLKRVVGSIPSRSLDALATLLEPKVDDAVNGVTDWFGTPRLAQQPHTVMRIVLVCEDIAYIPISVQDLLTQGGDPVVVTVASGLSAQEAINLIERYNR